MAIRACGSAPLTWTGRDGLGIVAEISSSESSREVLKRVPGRVKKKEQLKSPRPD
jgi:hypothetical protein